MTSTMVLATKTYLVTASGTKKETGEVYCYATAVQDFAGRGSGLSDERIRLENPLPVGTILVCDLVLREDSSV